MNTHHWEIAHNLRHTCLSTHQPIRSQHPQESFTPRSDRRFSPPQPTRSPYPSDSLHSTHSAQPPVRKLRTQSTQPTQSLYLAIAETAQQTIAKLQPEVAHALYS